MDNSINIGEIALADFIDRLASKEPVPGGGYDTSVFVDCFVALGMSRYATVSGDKRYADFADARLASILERVASGSYRSDPYPIPTGYIPHGTDMLIMHTARELRQSHTAATEMEAVLSRFFDSKLVREYVPAGGGFDDENLLGRYVNPGHSIECMWFALDVALDNKDDAAVAKILKIIRNSLEIGWDDEYGGLLLFCDKDGGRPTGSVQNAKEPMAIKVQADWDAKLWWVHSEALYTTLYAYTVSQDKCFLHWHEKLREYTFSTFPNPDKTIGEWINVRTRDGRPDSRVVALPVKDPYHIARNMLMLAELE